MVLIIPGTPPFTLRPSWELSGNGLERRPGLGSFRDLLLNVEGILRFTPEGWRHVRDHRT
jgi:hypothetical protein